MAPKTKRQRSKASLPSAPPVALPPEATIRNLIGMPVCAVLRDGAVYVGTLQAIDGGELILQGIRSDRTVSSNPDKAKAQISALGGLGSMLGGLGGAGGGLGGLFGNNAAAGAGAGEGGGFGGLGGLGRFGNWFRIGIGVMQFIFPLMKGFGI